MVELKLVLALKAVHNQYQLTFFWPIKISTLNIVLLNNVNATANRLTNFSVASLKLVSLFAVALTLFSSTIFSVLILIGQKKVN